MNLSPLLLSLICTVALPCDAANVVLYGPSSYRQRSESPFYGGIQRGSILVEDFEDGLLNTPGVSITTGSIVRFQGVDEDDGVLDGLGYVRSALHPWLPTNLDCERALLRVGSWHRSRLEALRYGRPEACVTVAKASYSAFHSRPA